jgi:uncharacterized protein YecE (DUF72 family)
MQQYQFIGTAGWNIPKTAHHAFPGTANHLQRYATALAGVEINSSFYRDHLPKTYARWAETTPPYFRFSVKLLQRFTHQQKLAVDESQLAATIAGIKELGSKLGVLLVQLPPTLTFHASTASAFCEKLRALYHGPIALEPRHFTWTSSEARILLLKFGVSKVRADPELTPVGELTAWETPELCYFRLHGSPEIYKSNYSPEALARITACIREVNTKEVWCIFDNTTFGHAWLNALDVDSELSGYRSSLAS